MLIQSLNNHHDINFNPTLLLENYLGIKFAHEINVNSQNLIDCFQNKLLKRIEKFKSLKNDSNNIKIRFIRIELCKIKIDYFNIVKNIIIQIEKYIKNFELIFIINNLNSFSYNNIDPRISIYNFDFFEADWKMDHLDWDKILFRFNNQVNNI
jgi:hypothetical protein